tara:strand:+ start:35 stop:199 length:165 start_codon:yes stop_codon:yes gene_type:complete
MATKYWRVETMTTMGWTLYNDTSLKLSKDQAKTILEGAMADGVKPSYLRAVPDV